MVVVSVSLSGKELKEFDSVADKRGFSSRSDAVREALHRFVAQNRWDEQAGEGKPLVATLVYEDRKEQPLHDVMRDFKDVIFSATHTHFADKCIEWIILSGSNSRIGEFMERVSAIKSVNVCRCSV